MRVQRQPLRGTIEYLPPAPAQVDEETGAPVRPKERQLGTVDAKGRRIIRNVNERRGGFGVVLQTWDHGAVAGADPVIGYRYTADFRCMWAGALSHEEAVEECYDMLGKKGFAPEAINPVTDASMPFTILEAVDERGHRRVTALCVPDEIWRQCRAGTLSWAAVR